MFPLRSQKRIGAFLWLTAACSAAEALLTIRFSAGQFPHYIQDPPVVVAIWTVGLVGLNLFTLLYFYVFKVHLKGAKESDAPAPAAGQRRKLSVSSKKEQ